jgi:hypothetical protein
VGRRKAKLLVNLECWRWDLNYKFKSVRKQILYSNQYAVDSAETFFGELRSLFFMGIKIIFGIISIPEDANVEHRRDHVMT